jgi:hypothetical protein
MVSVGGRGGFASEPVLIMNAHRGDMVRRVLVLGIMQLAGSWCRRTYATSDITQP